jgi:ribosomal protein S18 acetylase RimI-like enzyme
MKVRPANIEDEEFIKKLHKQHKEHIGGFNMFWVWDKYVEKKANYKYVVISNCGFMRYGYSKKYSAYVLYEIAVDEESKQNGIGKVLFNNLPRPLMLKCNQDNEIGNAFYMAMNMIKVANCKTKKGVKQNIYWIT